MAINIERIREKYKIPEHYHADEMPDGAVCFDWLDETIKIYPDGTATQSWMGLNATATGHEFITVPWKAAG